MPPENRFTDETRRASKSSPESLGSLAASERIPRTPSENLMQDKTFDADPENVQAPINTRRHRLAVGVVGGPTAVVDYGWVRFVTEPTFDPPGEYGPYRKLIGPAVAPTEVEPVDAVLLSHDLHMDNFDKAGRDFASNAPIVITGVQTARRLRGNARGLTSFESTVIGSTLGPRMDVTVHAVPAQHGPSDGERDEYGNINTEVTGFVLQADGLPTVYISGDNASILPVVDIAARFPDIAIAVLHVGAARVSTKNAGRPLTLTSDRAADVAQLLRADIVIPVHCEGWSLYSQTLQDTRNSFADAGIRSRLRSEPPGTWVLRGV
jgi:L-ascorbate metabolism protein UlaG (beta-lactamase superfamily)